MPSMYSFMVKDRHGRTINLRSRADRPAELDTGFINMDGFKRNLYKMYWEFRWTRQILKTDEVGHGGMLNELLVNNPQMFMRHSPFALWHTIIYGLALGLIGSFVSHLIATFWS